MAPRPDLASEIYPISLLVWRVVIQRRRWPEPHTKTRRNQSMFGQQQSLGRGQLCAHKSYRLADLWGGGNPGSPLMRKGAKDAAVFQDLDPGLKARVFSAAKRSANGKSTPEDEVLKDEIAAMLESGELQPSVAAALIRTCNRAPEPETNFGTLSPSLSTRSDGASDAPNRYLRSNGPRRQRLQGRRRCEVHESVEVIHGRAQHRPPQFSRPRPRDGFAEGIRARERRNCAVKSPCPPTWLKPHWPRASPWARGPCAPAAAGARPPRAMQGPNGNVVS